MRVLLISDEFGHPENTGYRRRIANIARALGALGDLEWVVLARPDGDGPHGPPPDLPVPLHVVPVALRPRNPALVRWSVSRLPWRVEATDVPALRRDIGALLADRVRTADVVFFTQLDTYLVAGPVLGRLSRPPRLVALDFNDLESHKERVRRGVLLEQRTPAALARALALAIDLRRWRRIERSVAGGPVLSFVCSDLDRGRAGGRPAVLPNVVPPPPAGYERTPDPARPTLLFVGSLSYAPNIDAARLAATEILPRVREKMPGAALRIVGHGLTDDVRRLGAHPGVEVVGPVTSVAPELARASLSVVPIRFGAGTRVKILEALAHHVPVVSTTCGAEGLELVDGEHLLLADDPAHLADSCIALLEDPARAARLADAGAAFVQRYDAATVRASLVTRLRAAYDAAGGTSSS